MVRPGEIKAIAAKLGLRDTQIEKDYIIGWVLKGISCNEFLNGNLIFKGGTAIRKVYNKDYRLSEDLDFTLISGSLDTSKIKAEFEIICRYVYEESRISMEIRDEKLHKTGNYNLYIGYSGPLGGNIRKKDIKLDISSDELICNKPQTRKIINKYSDLSENYELNCYSIQEIVIEKMRSLMQRSAARDLYDLWYLLENENIEIQDHLQDFRAKAEYKGYNSDLFKVKVKEKIEILRADWSISLDHQMKDIPDFDRVWREFSKHLKKF
jgi:uncharacterized protein